jgi:hypothetical protein
MTYVGGLVGTDAASSLGEYIAEWYFCYYAVLHSVVKVVKL